MCVDKSFFVFGVFLLLYPLFALQNPKREKSCVRRDVRHSRFIFSYFLLFVLFYSTNTKMLFSLHWMEIHNNKIVFLFLFDDDDDDDKR